MSTRAVRAYRTKTALLGMAFASAVAGSSECACSNATAFLSAEIPAGAPAIALTHARVIDGTGQPSRTDQTIVIRGREIVWVGASAEAAIPAGAHTLDLAGHTVFPGLVGVHNHLFYHTG